MQRVEQVGRPFTPPGRLAEKAIPGFLRPGHETRAQRREQARRIAIGEQLQHGHTTENIKLKDLKEGYQKAKAQERTEQATEKASKARVLNQVSLRQANREPNAIQKAIMWPAAIGIVGAGLTVTALLGGAILGPVEVLRDVKNLTIPTGFFPEAKRGRAARNIIYGTGTGAGIGALVGTFIIPGLGTGMGALLGAAGSYALRGAVWGMSAFVEAFAPKNSR